MKRTWTIIGVSDVPRSFKWYQSLFGQPATSPVHPDFGQLLDSDGTVLLCLHQWGVEDHPSLKSPRDGTPGNGCLLFFRVDENDGRAFAAEAPGRWAAKSWIHALRSSLRCWRSLWAWASCTLWRLLIPPPHMLFALGQDHVGQARGGRRQRPLLHAVEQ